jgi:hypothetical protein
MSGRISFQQNRSRIHFIQVSIFYASFNLDITDFSERKFSVNTSKLSLNAILKELFIFDALFITKFITKIW